MGCKREAWGLMFRWQVSLISLLIDLRSEAESHEEPKVAETEVEAKAEGAVEIAVTTEERPAFKPRVELGDIIGNRIQAFIPSITPNGIFALYSLLCGHGNINLLPDQIRSDAHISSFRLKVPSPELKSSLKIKENLEASVILKKLLLVSFLPPTSIVIADGVVSNFSIGYDYDDPSFEILEGKADGKIWKQYYKGWTESEDDKMYMFEEIVNVNASYVTTTGTWYYFTFKQICGMDLMELSRNTQADKKLGELKESLARLGDVNRDKEGVRAESSTARACYMDLPNDRRSKENINHEYVLALNERFGEGFEDAMEALKKLTQTHSVKEYQAEFDRLLSFVNLSVENQISCYLGGLTPELNKSVRLQSPRILMQAYKLTRLQDGVFQAQAKKGYTYKNFKTSGNSTEKRLTSAKMNENGAKGLYFFCDEKYELGHKCASKKQLYLIDMVDQGATNQLKTSSSKALIKHCEVDAQVYMLSLIPADYEVVHCCHIQADQGDIVPSLLTPLLDQFKSTFEIPSTLPPHRGPLDHRIPLMESANPISKRPYRYPGFKKDIIEKLVQEILDQGVIQHSTSPYASLVEYLGHFISAKGVATDPKKITAVQHWPIPSNLKQLRGFLGLAGYYRRFIQGFGAICQPVHELIRKEGFIWSDKATAAFEKLEETLTSTSVLALPDYTKTFLVETDAIGTDIGVGSENKAADALSRKPEAELLAISLLTHNEVLYSRIQASWQADPTLQEVINRLQVHSWLLQPLPIPDGIWTDVCLEFIEGLPKVQDKPKEWVSYLPLAEWWYNTTYHTTLKCTPYEVLYGQKPPIYLLYLAGESKSEMVDRSLITREAVIQLLRQVSVSTKPFNKLAAKYYGPYLIEARVGDVAYKLMLPSEVLIHPTFHVSQLKKYHEVPVNITHPPVIDLSSPYCSTPERVLDKRLVKKGNKPVEQLLIKWCNLDEDQAMWEFSSKFHLRFPSFNS
ncbi:hypothetical protein FXO37_17355 [Capsicum annuum]|nr:hypothetical protein FXO37_17355 [Capsicum annuum]